MGNRGVKPKGKVKIAWSPNFAYAIGLLVTDGSLSSDGRHIDFTSVDKEQVDNFSRCLGLKVKIGTKKGLRGLYSFRVQFGDVLFYRFLQSIGITPAKSLVIGEINIPEEYFFDFLRGCFDGDGCSYSYWDPRWKSSFMFYISFASSSEKFIVWLRNEINKRLKIKGHLTRTKTKNPYFQIKYAKRESIKLAGQMYKNKKGVFLRRKKLKINESLSTIGVPQIS